MSTHDDANSLLSALTLKCVSADEFHEVTSELRKSIFSQQLTVSNAHLYSEEELCEAQANMVRYSQLEDFHALLMLNGTCIGWHFGYQDGPMSYYMCNSAILPQYRRQGCYSWLARQVMNEVHTRGYPKIKSRHHPTNTPVLIAKLKLGFIISGLQLTANFGTLVELEWNGNNRVADLMQFRCGEVVAEPSILEMVGLSHATK